MADSSLIQSLCRGLDILQLVSQSPNGLRLYELAEQMNLKKTTVHNLARTLVVKEFLIQKESATYLPGPAISEMFLQQQDADTIQKISILVKQVYEYSNLQNVIYSELIGYDIIGRLKIAKDTHGHIQKPLGMIILPYCTASGLVYQAFATANQIQGLKQRHPFFNEGIELWKSKERLLEEVEKVRKNGYARFPFDKEGVRLAVPVFIHENELHGVITITIENKSKVKESHILDIIQFSHSIMK
jgi:IclR family transcriptional regulator, KDG regulon repressor